MVKTKNMITAGLGAVIILLVCGVGFYYFNQIAVMSDADFIELCKSGTLQEIKNAVKRANVNAWDDRGQTPLVVAVNAKRP